jgi:hypothetical protein
LRKKSSLGFMTAVPLSGRLPNSRLAFAKVKFRPTCRKLRFPRQPQVFQLRNC